MTLIGTVPFDGTYGTCYDPGEFDADDDYYSQDEYEALWWGFSPRLYLNELGKEYVNCFDALLTELIAERHPQLELPDELLKFESTYSPQFYNFDTDRIYAFVDPVCIDALWEFAFREREAFRDYLLAILSPRSGFIPYYSNQITDWEKLERSELDTVQVGVFLEFYVTHWLEDDWYSSKEEFLEDIYEHLRCNTSILTLEEHQESEIQKYA